MELSNIVYTWDDIDVCVDSIVRQISFDDRGKHLTHIGGIPRGGFILATMLSHRLNLEYVSDYKEACKVNPKSFLLCDDISDTGNTFKKYKSVHPYDYCLTASMHYKDSSSFMPDFWAIHLIDDRWVEYPWEKK